MSGGRALGTHHQRAVEAHARGDLAAAVAAQAAHLVELRARDGAQAEDLLFLGLLHYQAGAMDVALAVLEEGARAFPRSGMLHENLGVLLLGTGRPGEAIEACLRALDCEGATPNTYDCLADAAGTVGRMDLAVQYGRAALEAKDRMFAGDAPAVAIPGNPPPFNRLNPAENVISYVLWGDERRYLVPLLENLRVLNHLFPEWTVRVHLDRTVPEGFQAELRQHGAQLVMMELPPDVPAHRRLLWRFAVLDDPGVRRFLIRDADSLLTVKERVAVDAWLASPFHFHAMRDWHTHTDLLLAGMWGGVGGVLPDIETLLAGYRGWRAESNHVDQDVLSEMVWPRIRGHCLIHDSVFTGCLGSVAFPPFGALPPGHHVGENSFLRFREGQ